MLTVNAHQFYTTLGLMYPHVQNMVDEQCELAKQKMKEKAAAKLGSFQNAVTTANGAWLTRNHHSQNFTYQHAQVFGEAYPGEEVEKIHQCGLWGTLKEISEAATLFEADFYIFW